LLITEPSASYTLRDVKFSDAIRARPSRWRAFSRSIMSKTAGSVSESGAFSGAAHARVDAENRRRAANSARDADARIM
jgi:hypothetical protein